MVSVDQTDTHMKRVLDLSTGADPITGRLHVDDHRAPAFSGYLELMSLLEEIRHTQRPSRPRSDTQPRTQSPELKE